jgi:hypothetical protein
MSEIGGMRQQARLTRDVVRMNLEGISHEQSLIQPKPAATRDGDTGWADGRPK